MALIFAQYLILSSKAKKKLLSWALNLLNHFDLPKMTRLSLKFCIIALMIGLTAACSHHSKNKDENAKNSTDRSSEINYTTPLSFVNRQDTLATIKVAVAKTADERDEGLMDVHHMPENRGMLFIFGHPQKLSFWMANTPLPLDIIFVNKDHKIVRIHHSAKPFSQKNLPSGKKALYTVETNGGFCVAHDIHEGMKVVFEQ
jgi:uncharacterized membrane protein (UPF0127 family)